jgi:hypothetical protein
MFNYIIKILIIDIDNMDNDINNNENNLLKNINDNLELLNKELSDIDIDIDIQDIPTDIKNTTKIQNNKKQSIQFKNGIDLLTFEYFSKQKTYEKYLNTSCDDTKSDNNLSLISKHDKKFYKKRIINETKKMLKNEFDNEILKDSFNKYIFSLINYFKFKDKIDILQDEYKELNIDRTIYPITEINTELCDIDNSDDINIDNIDYNSGNINELLYNFNKKELNKKVTLDNFIISNKNKNDEKKQIIPLQKNIDLREPSLKTKGVKYKNKKKEIITNNIETNDIDKETIDISQSETKENEETQNKEIQLPL